MTSAKQLWAVVVVCLCVYAAPLRAQESISPTSRADLVAKLLKELRWQDREGLDRYLTVREDLTERVLREIDGYVSETVPNRNATLDLSKRLDRLLGHVGRDDTSGSVVFTVNLPIGRFLLVGVEVPRGGGAIPEDAISFRAFREAEGQFVPVTAAYYPRDGGYGDVFPDGGEPLATLNAKPLSVQPVGSQFWFMTWAQLASASSPPIVTAHLMGFDGERFRRLWTKDNFNSPYVNQAVQVAPDGGFTLRRMPNFREVRIINERYVVTADGPQKVAETESEFR
jgi:hypothetical protein